jgi:alkaline phosphatase D
VLAATAAAGGSLLADEADAAKPKTVEVRPPDAPGGKAGGPSAGAPPTAPLEPVDTFPANIVRPWLGRSFWANRLQDWRLDSGRFECLAGKEPGLELRTVALLTREIVRGDTPGHIAMHATVVEDWGGGGFCGFLVGVGGGKLDHRAAALCQRASGEGGGFLCVYETDGRLRFREHTSEENVTAYAELPYTTLLAPTGSPSRALRLQLDITPEGGGRFTVTLSLYENLGTLLSRIARKGVPDDELAGGISLVSSNTPGKPGARWALSDLKTGGAKIAKRPERAFGPVLGTLHTVNGKVMKLVAQLAPVGEREAREARLHYRTKGGGDWREAKAPIEAGYAAVFRVEGWDASKDHEYRVFLGDDASALAKGTAFYDGEIRRDPAGERPLTVALLSCVLPSARSLDDGVDKVVAPHKERLGRYTPRCLYFPHAALVANVAKHRPDLLVFAGDQIYEGNPTRRDPGPEPTLDYLYKWFLWVWSFRELARSTPAILMTDDHDVYHGNLWGNGGRAAPERDQNRGGYRCTPAFVNMVQRTQCGANPDAYDPAPVDQGIGVYYGAFRFGGASFAVLEDRKWKTSPVQGEDLDVHEAALLGERQEAFLAAWGKEGGPEALRICLTQSVFACVQTSPQGKPLVDWDANGYPKIPRDRAVRLLREARALVLSGDQHLASLVRHGVESFTDGPLQFSGPAGGSMWQRWFEPQPALANGRGPHTGDFVDAFGNRLRVLAVANPRVSFAEYRRGRKGRPQDLGDRALKREGYGIVRVDFKAREITLECWPHDADPKKGGGAGAARQFEGWPYKLAFAKLASE